MSVYHLHVGKCVQTLLVVLRAPAVKDTYCIAMAALVLVCSEKVMLYKINKNCQCT